MLKEGGNQKALYAKGGNSLKKKDSIKDLCKFAFKI